MMATTPVAVVDVSALALTPLDIGLRMLLAMLVGAVIGTEREYTHRPAGMRTHMLVALGACAVMTTSQMIFWQYRPYGATPDPARLSAQVITGLGFLGAGTIMREGPSVKGLTTAAGLWATAGIGLAIGSGFYSIGIFSTVLMLALQILMHKFLVHADSLVSGQLQFTVRAGETFVEDFRAFIRERGIQATDSKITYHEDGFVSYEMFVRLPRTIPLGELDAFLKTCGDVRCVGYTAMP